MSDMDALMNQPSDKRRVAVVGAGITGLTAAYRVTQQRPDVEVVLLERTARLGGNIRTERVDGFLIDAGPDAFLRTKTEAVELARELGLESDLVTTQERRVYVVHRGKLVVMPAGMALAVPTRLGPLFATPLVGWGSKLRVARDLVWPARRRPADEDESIHDFVAGRFGHDAAERLAAPLLGGIYAGDVHDLSIQATFPQLVEMERKHGSLILGLFAAQRARDRNQPATAPKNRLAETWELVRWLWRPAAAAPSPFYSFGAGVGALTDALASRLPRGAVRLEAELSRLLPPNESSPRWRLSLGGAGELEADAVILTTPAHVAARLVPDPALREELSGIPYVSTATVFFGYPRAAVRHPLDAVGFIVPRGEADVFAATFVTSKWDHRAPEGHVLLRVFFGSSAHTPNPDSLDDGELVAIGQRELEHLLGPLGSPVLTRVYRYPRANPQPLVGHPSRLRRIAAELRRCPGLYLAGGAYRGVGIPDCIAQATDAAARALAERCPLDD
jgi:oxygen-dependent protoporphyrinogen oxidase